MTKSLSQDDLTTRLLELNRSLANALMAAARACQQDHDCDRRSAMRSVVHVDLTITDAHKLVAAILIAEHSPQEEV